jgi:hypothetical protein
MTQPSGEAGLTWTTQNPCAPGDGSCACGCEGRGRPRTDRAVSPVPLMPMIGIVTPATDKAQWR